MAHSIEIPLLRQTKNHEIEEGLKVDHSIDIKDTQNAQDPSGSQTEKSVNQMFDEKFKDLENSSITSCTIFKVNVCLRESNQNAYTPKMVSIGPYHKNNSQLGPMENYKLLYLQRFLQRKKGLNVESCIKELEELKEKAIKCYDSIEDLDKFCQMLLLDGCFVVEFFRERCEIYKAEKEITFLNRRHIFRDLMLLENQLPFFVLDKLHHITKKDDESPLAILVSESYPFFVKLQKMTLEYYREIISICDIKHLLHLVHILSCRETRICKSNYDIRCHRVMPNATELSEAGVSFEKVSDTTSLFDGIKFENGLMKIPFFEVKDSTETLLRNFIAYEQQSLDVYPTYFSDFAIFMDNVIESDKDVTLLRQKGIIENWLGDDKEVASMFNKMGNGVTIYDDFYYKEECTKACQHCGTRWNKTMASLKRNYFSSPWVGASTMAAIILLLLTAIQTILAFTGSVK